jgi:hypothetical protein
VKRGKEEGREEWRGKGEEEEEEEEGQNGDGEEREEWVRGVAWMRPNETSEEDVDAEEVELVAREGKTRKTRKTSAAACDHWQTHAGRR